MAKQKSRHFLLYRGDGTMKVFKMPRITMKKSLIFAAILGFLFIVDVSGQAADGDVNTNSSKNSSSSINNSTDSLLTNPTSSNSSNVVSSCVCAGGVPCAKNITSTDCPNGRVIARRDCPCCFVCAKQLTESCNEEDSLCDSDYGLTCGSDKKCQAKVSCSDDTSCSSELMCLGGACADPCKVLPDVCREMQLKNGMCIVRNHRPICSCSPGQSVNSEKQCVPTQEEATHCEMNGLTYKIGTTFYKEVCGKVCKCESSGSLNCKDVEGHPECGSGMVPLSKLGGEMTRACKLLIGHGNDFDGCCVPEQCANVTVPHDDVELQTQSSDEDDTAKKHDKPDNADEAAKGGREFKITGSPNNKVVDDSTEEGKSSVTAEANKAEPSVIPIQKNHEQPSSQQVMILQRTDHSAVIELPKSDNEAILSIALTSEHNKDPSNAQVWKEHRIPQGLMQITLSDLIPSTSYTLKYSVNGKDSPAVQFITNDVGAATPPENSSPSSSSSRGVGTATGRSMNIDEVTPTGSVVIADSTESSSSASSEVSPTTMSIAKAEGSEEKENNDKMSSSSAETESGSAEMDHQHEDTVASPSSTASSPVKGGCMYNGSSYEVGHEILNGCDEKCTCMETGEVKCIERCLIPTFKKGAFAHDDMCTEEPVDECCVIIACARGGSPSEAEARELIPIHPEPCDSVKCGKNARCLGPSGMLGDDENQTNQTLCLCNEGMVGDPYDEKHGCQESVTPSTPVEGSSPPSAAVIPSAEGPTVTTTKHEGCIFNNQTFEYGDEHLDGCNYKCRCEHSGEFTCLPRCNYRRDDENEIPMGCEIQKDPSDSCCEMLVCHGKPLESGTRKDDSTTLDDGCSYKNKTYARDETFYDGCESQCMCISNGDVSCRPRCPPAGPHSGENNCVTLEDPVDKCCKVTICGNQTLYDEVMKAEAAKKSTPTDSSTELPSSVPPATGIQRSMTSSEEIEAITSGEGGTSHQHQGSSSSSELPPTGSSAEHQHELDIKISMVVPLNNTAMMITVSVPENELATLLQETIIVRYSHDLTTWRDQEFRIKNLFTEGSEELHTVVTGLASGQQYYFKALIKGFESNVASGLTKMHAAAHTGHGHVHSGEEPSSSMEGHSHGSGSMEHMLIEGSDEDEGKADISSSIEAGGEPCLHKGKKYQPGEEFYDACEAYCLCDGKGNVTCVDIDCPKDGRELIDESCVRWEPDMRDFKKEPPFCCPDMICVQHSHCELEDGYILQNFEEIPQKLTGCDKTCQCLYGNITCHPGNNCPPVSENPPAALACPPGLARQIPMIENECCFQWACINHTAGHFPPPPPPFGLPHHPSQHANDATQVSNIMIQPLNESTLQIDFTVSPILVGLHGHVEVLYTKDYSRKPNPAQWESKVFQQAEDLIDNTHLQLFLTSLEPDTDYHMQIRVVVMAQFQPTSDILLVRTPLPSVPTTTLPPEIMIDPEIQLASSGSRSVKLHWKKFDDGFDNLVDGVQIAYKESEDKVYSTTPLIHRSVTEYELVNLKPNKDYEVNLLFIPFHTDQKTILKSEKPIFIKTDREEDEYAFDVGLSPGKVSESTVELRVSGIPPPEDKFVNIYQVFYSSDAAKEEQKSYFKVPKTETSKRATLTDLRPGTKYTIWLEAFLTNGKKKRSNVIDVVTKAGQLPSPEKSEQETQESKPELPETSSYYGALVALAIVAAMSILGIIALLMILIKKQSQAKAPINDRKSESSYDNPSFKSYDIESNGHVKPGEL